MNSRFAARLLQCRPRVPSPVHAFIRRITFGIAPGAALRFGRAAAPPEASVAAAAEAAKAVAAAEEAAVPAEAEEEAAAAAVVEAALRPAGWSSIRSRLPVRSRTSAGCA